MPQAVNVIMPPKTTGLTKKNIDFLGRRGLLDTPGAGMALARAEAEARKRKPARR